MGALLTPITLAGFIWGYIFDYNRVLKKEGVTPSLLNAKTSTTIAMLVGAVLAWGCVYFGFKGFMWTAERIFDYRTFRELQYWLLIANVVLSVLVIRWFERWVAEVELELAEMQRFGTARFANEGEIKSSGKGLFIGGSYTYDKQGHIITVAGTRGGKGVNLIIPNLLGAGDYKGSWVVVDPKGEAAAITSRWQKSQKRRVIKIDPWGGGDSYNPLDLLDPQSDDFADDSGIVAEMIVPIKPGASDFFADRARSFINGILMHHVMTQDREDWNISFVWEALRLDREKWIALLSEMSVSENKVVQATANEIINVLETSEKTYGSILSVAQQHTDFLKSPALQKSLKSSFDSRTITDGNTTVYITIPADKLKTHYQWLRLVVTTLMRISVRNRKERITFLLDEFSALGYIPEIEVALSTYAGYNITVWPILQNLMQLETAYGKGWETFLGNTAVKHFFTVRDNFTAEYISRSFGDRTFISKMGGKPNATARRLATADEIMRASGDFIFCRIEDYPPTYFEKFPYYLDKDFQGRSDKNPYV